MGECILSTLPTVKFYSFLLAYFIFKINIKHLVSNILVLDHARHFIGPDRGPNCLQSLPTDDQIASSKERI